MRMPQDQAYLVRRAAPRAEAIETRKAQHAAEFTGVFRLAATFAHNRIVFGADQGDGMCGKQRLQWDRALPVHLRRISPLGVLNTLTIHHRWRRGRPTAKVQIRPNVPPQPRLSSRV